MNQKSFPRVLILAAAALTAVAASAATITVTESRLVDQRIQADVTSTLSRNTELSGRVAVESKDAVVTLSGYLATQGQVRRAAREASQVAGVKFVVNEIRPQLGVVSN